MKLIAFLSILSMTALADTNYDCASCDLAAAGDCHAALAKIDGKTAIDPNADTNWQVGGCIIRYLSDGVAPDPAAVKSAAEAFVNKCCNGPWCSGVAYDTGSSTGLQSGCVCVEDSTKSTCQCNGGVNSLSCLPGQNGR